jgi:hypothetical protein
MLENIIESGSAFQKKRALNILAFGGQMRGRRQALSQVRIRPSRAPQDAKQRYVYSSQFGPDLPGILKRSEGDPPSGDEATDEAYDVFCTL